MSVYGDNVSITGLAYDRLVALGKPFAFTEFGPGGRDWSWDNMSLLDSVQTQYPATTYALFWSSSDDNKLTVIDNRNSKELLNSPWVVNRDDLDWKSIAVPEKWQHPAKTDIGH